MYNFYNPVTEPLLTPHGQSKFLQDALIAFREDNTPEHVAASSSSANTPEHVAAAVAKMQGHAGNRQVAVQKVKKPIKERVNKARQRVDWANRFLQWTLFEYVLNYVIVHEGTANEKMLESRPPVVGWRMLHHSNVFCPWRECN